MNTQLVFLRTDKGNQEISARTYHLPQRLRVVLILVDGKSTVSQLRDKAVSLPRLEDSLEDLAINGFIRANSASWDRRVGAAPRVRAAASYEGEERRRGGTNGAFTSVRARLIDLAIITFGARAENLVKIFREAPGSWQGFEGAISNATELVTAVFDESSAEQFRSKSWQVLTSALRANAEIA